MNHDDVLRTRPCARFLFRALADLDYTESRGNNTRRVRIQPVSSFRDWQRPIAGYGGALSLVWISERAGYVGAWLHPPESSSARPARGDRPTTYITLLRNPVDRVLSLYHFLEAERQTSIEEFVAHPSIKEVDNDQTRRIAGVDPAVGGCTNAMLLKAMENMRRHFAVAASWSAWTKC